VADVLIIDLRSQTVLIRRRLELAGAKLGKLSRSTARSIIRRIAGGATKA